MSTLAKKPLQKSIRPVVFSLRKERTTGSLCPRTPESKNMKGRPSISSLRRKYENGVFLTSCNIIQRLLSQSQQVNNVPYLPALFREAPRPQKGGVLCKESIRPCSFYAGVNNQDVNPDCPVPDNLHFKFNGLAPIARGVPLPPASDASLDSRTPESFRFLID